MSFVFDKNSLTSFEIEANYRLQSVRSPFGGYLKGFLVGTNKGLLDAVTINTYLETDSCWRRHHRISLRVALIKNRTGVFADHDDALYYASNFVQKHGSIVLQHDLLDLTKLMQLKSRRESYLSILFDESSWACIQANVDPFEIVASNEYMCHEGGHALGFSISDKLDLGFFRTEGKLTWPLVYMEEFRADILSWKIAALVLSAKGASGVICRTLTHRFGLAIENLQYGLPGAGFIPFLHFALALETGLLSYRSSEGNRSQIVFVNPTTDGILAGALECVKKLDIELKLSNREVIGEEEAQLMLEFLIRRVENRQLTLIFSNIFGN